MITYSLSHRIEHSYVKFTCRGVQNMRNIEPRKMATLAKTQDVCESLGKRPQWSGYYLSSFESPRIGGRGPKPHEPDRRVPREFASRCIAPVFHRFRTHFVNNAWNDVTVFYVEVVVGSKDIGGNDGGELAAVLLVVEVVHDVDGPFGVAVARVRRVWGPVVNLGCK